MYQPTMVILPRPTRLGCVVCMSIYAPISSVSSRLVYVCVLKTPFFFSTFCECFVVYFIFLLSFFCFFFFFFLCHKTQRYNIFLGNVHWKITQYVRNPKHLPQKRTIVLEIYPEWNTKSLVSFFIHSKVIERRNFIH